MQAVSTIPKGGPFNVQAGFALDYPDVFLPVSKKNKEWAHAYLRAMFQNHNARFQNSWYQRMSECWLYRHGKNGTEKFKKVEFQTQEGEFKPRSTYLHLDYTMLSIMSKFADVVRERIVRRGYNVTANAIDAHAETQRNRAKYMHLARIRVEQSGMYDEVSEMMGTDMRPQLKPGEPTNEKELDVYMKYGYKIDTEIAMQEGIRLTFDYNKWKEEYENLVDGLITFGIGATRQYTDERNRIITEYCDIRYCILDQSEYKDYRDSRHFGVIKYYSMAELKRLAAAENWDENRWKEILRQASASGVHQLGRYNPMYPDQFFREWTSPGYPATRIGVLHGMWKSYDDRVWEEKTSKKYGFGSRITEITGTEDELNEPTNGTSRTSKRFMNVYEGSWIIGTDAVFCFKPNDNQPRNQVDYGKLAETLLPFQVYRVAERSLVDKLMSIVDQYMIAWLKFQQYALEAAPPGLAIDESAIVQDPAGKPGSFGPLDRIQMWKEKGVMRFRSIDPDLNRASGREPIIEISLEYTPEMLRWMEIMRGLEDNLRTMSGVNESVDSSQSDPDRLVGIAEFQQLAADTAIGPIFKGARVLTQKTAEVIAGKLQVISKNMDNGMQGYIEALGMSAVSVIREFADISMNDFGISIEDYPSDAEQQMINQSVMEEAVKYTNTGGATGITAADKIEILRIPDPKLKALVLSTRIEMREKQAQERKMQDQQMNAQIQEQAGLAVEKGKQETMLLDFDLYRKKKLEVDLVYEQELLKLDGQNKMGDAELKARHQLKGAQLRVEVEKDKERQRLDVQKEIEEERLRTEEKLRMLELNMKRMLEEAKMESQERIAKLSADRAKTQEKKPKK